MAGNRTAVFTLSAQDSVSAVLGRIEGNLGKLGTTFGKLGGIATGALAAFGVGFSIKGIADMIEHANELTESLDHTSQRLGIGITNLQAYEGWAKKGGVAIDELSGLLTKLEKNIGLVKLNESSKEAVAAFDRVGLSVQQVKAGQPDEIFEKIVAGLGKIGDPSVRAATAIQLFGKQGAAALTLVAGGIGGLEEEKKLLNDLGLALTDIDASKVERSQHVLDDLGTAAQAAKQKIGAELAPAITYLGNELLDAGKKGGGLGKQIHDGVDGAIVALDRMITGAKAIGDGWKLASSFADAGFSEAKGQLESFYASFIDIYQVRFPQAINDFFRSVERFITGFKQGFDDAGAALANSIITPINSAGKAMHDFAEGAIKDINNIIDGANKLAHVSLIPKIPSLGTYTDIPAAIPLKATPFKWTDYNPNFYSDTSGAEEDRDKWDSYAKFDLGHSDGLLEEQKGFLADLTKDLGDFNSPDGGAALQGWRQYGNAVDDVKNKIAPDDYSSGGGIPGAMEKAKKAVEEKVPKMVKEFDLLSEYGSAFTKDLEKSIDDFAKSGKFNFKEFSASVLQDLAAITMKAAILGGILGNEKWGGTGSVLGIPGMGGSILSGYLAGWKDAPKAVEVPETSFDGGGFTGYGARSGGVDGKGGFPAILHPNETVVDHTKGQSLGDTHFHNYQTVYITETMPSGQARALVAAATSAATGQIRQINKRGGKRRTDYLGRR